MDEPKSKIAVIAITDLDLSENTDFVESIRNNFQFPIVNVFTIADFERLKQDGTDPGSVMFVSSTFEGGLFERLQQERMHVVSDIIVQECIEKRQSLPIRKHPLFNWNMKDYIICFSIDRKSRATCPVKLNRYLNLIRYMGGQSRKDMKSGRSFERTHLIESSTNSHNYRMASVYELPILTKEWIEHVWSNRREPDYDSRDPLDFAKFRIKPFNGVSMTLVNFDGDQADDLRRQIVEQDGEVHDFDDCRVSHLVINNVGQMKDYIDLLSSMKYLPKFVVTEKWLEDSLKTKYRADEELYEIAVPLELRQDDDDLSSLNSALQTSFGPNRFNSILSKSAFDQSLDESLILSDSKTDKNTQKKFAITQELYQTELNYVTILKDILKVFYQPLVKHDKKDELPNDIELKTIFGGLRPIIEVHEKVIQELEAVVNNWSAENEVGSIFRRHSNDFLSAYPQYINFFEKTKEMFQSCQEKYPKFAAFVKASEAQPECKKQKFQELLINPIQRLPRIEMYLRALLDKTDELHPDYKPLNEALTTIMSVNSEINQEKKKTEGQIEMFDLLNEIEDCPATVLSANRQFIQKIDVQLFIVESNSIEKLDNVYSLLLFSDLILLCKKRTVFRSTSLKENRAHAFNSLMRKNKKTYKFVESIDISSIITISSSLVSDSLQVEDGMFVLMTSMGVRSYCSYPFVFVDPDPKVHRQFFDTIGQLYLENQSPMNVSNIFRNVELKIIDFEHCHEILKTTGPSRFDFIRKTKKRLNRTLSGSKGKMRSSISMENISSIGPSSTPKAFPGAMPPPSSSALPGTPSAMHTPSKRSSIVPKGFMTSFNSFLLPRLSSDAKPPIASRKMGSITNLNEAPEEAVASAPTTPAARKKRYEMEP